jgi:ectoine hydroxylase-related dioxygenase (phytanoyl-CoA dioxygenase family)
VSLFDEIETNGYAILPRFIEREAAQSLVTDIERLTHENESIHRRGRNKATYAIRNLLNEVESVRALAQGGACLNATSDALNATAFPVRGILFDKTPEANWKVRWHQDCAVPLREKIETPGFSGWSVKDGVIHAEAPASVLEKMVAIRIHLDDCGASNGPLRVLPGTHRDGVLSREKIIELSESQTAKDLCVGVGDAILMKPLLLHASAPAESPAHRRVIHIEYSCGGLPEGLRWA